MMRTYLLIVLLFSLFFPADSDAAGMKGRKTADWVQDATIYCIYPRSFSPEGTLGAIEKRIPELKDLGISVIWLMPIHPVGMKERKGTLGSPYSVRDYYDINPEFGSILDFQKLLATVHKNKMKLIIDLVINHTSWDSKLIAQHPEWYTKDSAGKIIPPNDDWTDVADLDYSKTGLRNYMLNMMEWWVKDIGIDGFRCDVSELVPLDFWEEARDKLEDIKPVMMLSEGSLPEHHNGAFDITYSWNIYDPLQSLISGERKSSCLDSILTSEAAQFPENALRLRFNTNHDKNAWDAPAITKFGQNGLRLSTVLVNTIPGIPLLYNGEEVANDKKLSLFEKISIDWNGPRHIDSLCRDLFKIRREHKALSRGTYINIPSSDDAQIFSFLRSYKNDKVMVVLNFSGVRQSPELFLQTGKTGFRPGKISLKELFSQDVALAEVGGSFRPSLEPYGYLIYNVTQK